MLCADYSMHWGQILMFTVNIYIHIQPLPRILEKKTRMNGHGLKTVAFQISHVGLCIMLKFSGELLGVIHSMCKNFGEV